MKTTQKWSKMLMLGVSAIILAFGLALSGCASLFDLFKGKSGTDQSVTFWDTSLLQGVTRITNDGLKKDDARISPDGLKLIYCEAEKTVSEKGSDPYDFWNIVMLRNASVAAKTKLISDYAFDPSWYGDSNRFLYVTNESGVNKILRTAASGGGKTYITRSSVGNLNRDYGPAERDGVILGYTLVQTTPSNRYQLISMKDNGTEITTLGDGRSPSWHPTEAKFLYVRDGDLYEMDFATTQETMLFTDTEGYNVANPSYSADGNYILFQKGAEAKTIGTNVKGLSRKNVVSKNSKWQIFSIKADGTELASLTNNNVNTFSPSLSVDGYMYFISDASGKTEIYRAKVNFDN